jgi:hypothetical protein
MSYQFSAAEISQLQAARLLCPPGDAQATSTGNWVPFYTALTNMLEQRIAGGTVGGADLQDMRNAKLWLDVAIGANGGTGMHSAFIRTYTNLQGELRRGSAFSDAEMQLASNGVALNLWQNLSDPDNRYHWKVPPISEIAKADASSIGVNLFGPASTYPLQSNDTAVSANSAWSGALGFNLLGGSPPYESWRLLTGGDGAANTASTPNTLDDFKNVLFAVVAYDKALKAGVLAGTADLVDYFSRYLSYGLTGAWVDKWVGPPAAQVAIGLSSGNWLGLIKDVASRSPTLSPVVNAISGVGLNRFLDMVMGASLGKSLLGTTTDTNFTANARAYFGLTPEQLQTLRASLLPTSTTDKHNLALVSVNTRAALAALSSVSVQVAPDVAARFAMEAEGGNITSQWIADRAYMLGWLEVSQGAQTVAPTNGISVGMLISIQK